MSTPSEYDPQQRRTITQRIVLRALEVWESPTTAEEDKRGGMSLAVYMELKALEFEPSHADQVATHTADVVLGKADAARAAGKSPREVVLDAVGLDQINPWRDAYLNPPRDPDNPA